MLVNDEEPPAVTIHQPLTFLRSAVLATAAAVTLLIPFGLARAETSEVRIAQQFGVSYLPLIVMKEQKLIEKHAQRAGIGQLSVTWSQFSGGAVMTTALLSGNLDVAAGGITPLLKLWSKTKGNMEVHGIASLGNVNMYLNTTNPDVKSIADFTAKDKIAVPAVRGSLQAEVLQMAASKQWGIENHTRLDSLTVSMRHPDALAALLSGSGITAHFANSPFQEQELQDPRVRRVLSSYDVLGGPGIVNTIFCSAKFRADNPKVYASILNAYREAIAWINEDKRRAAAFYVNAEKSKLSADFVHKIIAGPDYEYTHVPLGVMKYADFLHKVKSIKDMPATWKDVFFPEIHNEAGS